MSQEDTVSATFTVPHQGITSEDESEVLSFKIVAETHTAVLILRGGEIGTLSLDEAGPDAEVRHYCVFFQLSFNLFKVRVGGIDRLWNTSCILVSRRDIIRHCYPRG